jgi:hypothetical protein
MIWVLSKTGGWIVEEKERKHKKTIPQLPDEIVLFIYKLSQDLLMKDIRIRGIHPLFDTMKGYSQASLNGSYMHNIKESIDKFSAIDISTIINSMCRLIYWYDINSVEPTIITYAPYFLIVRSIRRLVNYEYAKYYNTFLYSYDKKPYTITRYSNDSIYRYHKNIFERDITGTAHYLIHEKARNNNIDLP